jgi:hypothetical protein
MLCGYLPGNGRATADEGSLLLSKEVLITIEVVASLCLDGGEWVLR